MALLHTFEVILTVLRKIWCDWDIVPIESDPLLEFWKSDIFLGIFVRTGHIVLEALDIVETARYLDLNFRLRVGLIWGSRASCWNVVTTMARIFDFEIRWSGFTLFTHRLLLTAAFFRLYKDWCENVLRFLESNWRWLNWHEDLVLVWSRNCDFRHNLDNVTIIISRNGNCLRCTVENHISREWLVLNDRHCHRLVLLSLAVHRLLLGSDRRLLGSQWLVNGTWLVLDIRSRTFVHLYIFPLNNLFYHGKLM